MKIAPSILTCDFSDIKNEIKKLTDRDCEVLHLDVMDGVFVPSITFGAKFIDDLVKIKGKMIFDTHLMVHDALIATQFVNSSEYVTVHFESKNCLQAIKEINKTTKSGVSIKPNTEVDEIIKLLPLVDQVLVMSVEPGKGGQKFMQHAVDKIKELAKLREENDYHYIINVDGGINEITAKIVKDAGCDFVVSGSFIISNPDNLTLLNNL